MKKIILYTMLLFAGNTTYSQKPTMPEINGYRTGRTMSVRGFPFNIKGIPFSQLQGSLWGPASLVVAELHMTYYMEGDKTQYGNRTIKNVRVRAGGAGKSTALRYCHMPTTGHPGKDWCRAKRFTAFLFIRNTMAANLTDGTRPFTC